MNYRQEVILSNLVVKERDTVGIFLAEVETEKDEQRDLTEIRALEYYFDQLETINEKLRD